MKLVTAHDLRSGEVVYLTARQSWSKQLADAAAFADEDADAALGKAKAQPTLVTNAYLIEADAPGAPSARVRLRERIRAQGPTVRRDLGKQAAG